MMRHWLAGAAAFAMMTGVAFAEDRPAESSTTTRSVTTTAAPAAGSYKATETRRGNGWGLGHYKWKETHRGADRYGYGIDTKRTYRSNANGSTVTSKTRTTTPDAWARSTYREKATAPSPYSGSTTEKTTTTINR